MKGPRYRNSKCADMHVVCLYITKALHAQFGTFISNFEKQKDKNLSLAQANSLLNHTAPAKKGFFKKMLSQQHASSTHLIHQEGKYKIYPGVSDDRAFFACNSNRKRQ